MQQTLHTRLTDESIWQRILSMLVLAVAYSIAETLLIILVIAQVLFRLFGGSVNEPLRTLGRQLSDYLYRIFMFLTFNSDYRPFPFGAWADPENPRVIMAPADPQGEQAGQ